MLNNITKDEVALFIKDGSNVSSELMTGVINYLSVSNNYI